MAAENAGFGVRSGINCSASLRLREAKKKKKRILPPIFQKDREEMLLVIYSNTLIALLVQALGT